jgi:hypothetical protein
VRIARTIVALVVLATLASPGRATTFVGMSERTLARSADAIVIATVERIESVTRPDGPISTLVTLAVEEEVKGRVGRVVTLRQPGGRVGDRSQWIFGSPRFARGERQLVFLSRHRDGTVRTTAFGLGQFALRPHPRTGVAMAERRLDAAVLGQRPVRRVRLARLLRTIARATATQAPRVASPMVTAPAEPDDPGLQRVVVDEFTFLGPSPSGRWFEADGGQPVVYGVDPAGDTALGPEASFAAIDGALAAWTNVTGASISLQRGPAAAPERLGCNGVSQIVFNDPFDEMPSPSGCSGILALGGYCASSTTGVVNGTSFVRITEGNITFNRGFGSCPFWNTANLAEVATHEIGHTIGIGHSSEADSAPPELKDATMYYRAHFDGRGAAVRADDIAALRFIYPGAGTGDPTVDDTDADGLTDAEDNCAGIANAAQTDTDADGLGDLCDVCPLVPGDDAQACQPIFVSRLKATASRGGTRLAWRGMIDAPDGLATPGVRALLVGAAGVVFDTGADAGLTGVAQGAARLRYRSGTATVTLKRMRGGVYRLRMKARGVTLGPDNVPLISASLQIGAATFTDSLTCPPRRGRRLRCES